MNTKAKEHDIQALLKELEEAYENYQSAGARVMQSLIFAQQRRGGLNEHQFVAKMEAAGNDQERVLSVIRNQTRLRLSYMSGCLALQCSFAWLTGSFEWVDSHLGVRDRLIAAIVKTEAAVKAMSPGHERDLLAGRCLEVISTYGRAHRQTVDRVQKEWHRDPTDGRAQESLELAYRLTLAKTYPRFYYTEGFQESLELAYKLTGGLQFDGKHADIDDMMLIPLHHGNLRVCNLSDLTEVNDKLVSLAKTTKDSIWSNSFISARNKYHAAKSQLNEVQYSMRLERAFALNDTDEAARIKEEQLAKRAEFLFRRASLTECFEEAARKYEQLMHLNTQLSNLIAVAEKEIPRALHATLPHMLVAKNNFVAVIAILASLAKLQSTGRWAEELKETENVSATAREAVKQALDLAMSQPVFECTDTTLNGDQS